MADETGEGHLSDEELKEFEELPERHKEFKIPVTSITPEEAEAAKPIATQVWIEAQKQLRKEQGRLGRLEVSPVLWGRAPVVDPDFDTQMEIFNQNHLDPNHQGVELQIERHSSLSQADLDNGEKTIRSFHYDFRPGKPVVVYTKTTVFEPHVDKRRGKPDTIQDIFKGHTYERHEVKADEMTDLLRAVKESGDLGKKFGWDKGLIKSEDLPKY